MIDAQTPLTLTNAIYLKASWRKRFKDAVGGTFHCADGSNVRAKMMRLSETLGYGAGDGYEAVRLLYAGGLSMILVVPSAGKLDSLERDLDGPTLRRAVNGLSNTPVKLSMPKFSFRSKARLKGVLGELGMPIAFTSRADFSGITNEEPLQVADVIHEAFIAVDEKGTEAAAAAALVYVLSIAPLQPVELTIDRPFLFLIQDDETGAILFMGRMSDPTR